MFETALWVAALASTLAFLLVVYHHARPGVERFAVRADAAVAAVVDFYAPMGRVCVCGPRVEYYSATQRDVDGDAVTDRCSQGASNLRPTSTGTCQVSQS